MQYNHWPRTPRSLVTRLEQICVIRMSKACVTKLTAATRQRDQEISIFETFEKSMHGKQKLKVIFEMGVESDGDSIPCHRRRTAPMMQAKPTTNL